MAATQEDRRIQLTSPLGADVLLFSEFTCSEHLSQPFSIDLVLLSEKGDIDADKILAQPLTITAQLPAKDKTRYFNGIVTEFSQTGFVDRYHQYHATLRPWFWFLSRTADCRIFQGKTVPEIFEEVVKQYRFTDYELKLRANYSKWEYCVQYRETDFNFLSRLLEQEGIYYYFQHSDKSHQMVLVDDPTAHKAVGGYETIPFYPPNSNPGDRERDHLVSILTTRSVQTGVYASTDFDFEKPKLSLAGKSTISAKHARADFEIFDYPVELQDSTSAATEKIAKLRIQELHALSRVVRASGNAAGLAHGHTFKFAKHPRTDLNAEYLIVAAHIAVSSDDYQTGGSGTPPDWSVSIDAIESKIPFRPARNTPKPVVQGTQTAIVVGKSGEEIWTDKYGRVKVQFHWDRHGKANETSSCWVRVAQLWAGKNWGAIHVPRIGQEVLVSFLEGDPDQPIITGRVYNGEEMPPYTLPDNATQSGIKSNSSKGGGGSNELRFEDKSGSEEIYLHAQKDWNTQVENNQTTEIKNDRTDKVDKNESLTVSKDRKREVGGAETVKIDKDQTIDVGKKFKLQAADEITLQTGSAKIVMKKNGEITIEGLNITIKGSTSVKIESSVKVEIKGTQTTVKGTMLELSADAIAKLRGGMTMIG